VTGRCQAALGGECAKARETETEAQGQSDTGIYGHCCFCWVTMHVAPDAAARLSNQTAVP